MITRKYISKDKSTILHFIGKSVYDSFRCVIDKLDFEGHFLAGQHHEFLCDFEDIEKYYVSEEKYNRIY